MATLKDIMSRSDVPLSEKYRRILEAYQIEMEYGRTLDSYDGTIGEGDDAAHGRVRARRPHRAASTRRSTATRPGYWDQDQKKWVQDDDYRSAREGRAVGRQEGGRARSALDSGSGPKEVKS